MTKLNKIRCYICDKHLGYEAINYSDIKYMPKDFYRCNNYKIYHMNKATVVDEIKVKTHIDVFYNDYNICPKCIDKLLRYIDYYDQNRNKQTKKATTSASSSKRR